MPPRKLLTILLLLLAGCSHDPAYRVRVATWHMNPVPADQVNLLLFGDWGNESAAQRDVAESMARYASSFGVQFNAVLSAGDNTYLRLRSSEDPRFERIFENMYDPQRLAMPFYMTLGNHDYYFGSDKAELAYAKEHPGSRWKLPDRYYRLDFPRKAEPSESEVAPTEPPAPGSVLVAVLMLDSNIGPMSDSDWKRQLEWLDSELARARREARWVVCVQHHPLFSAGMHGDNPTLQQQWGTLFKKHRIDLSIAGHDHDMQHLVMPGWPMSFMVVGGGGAGKRWIAKSYGPFAQLIHGFGHLHITKDRLTARLLNAQGEIVHEFTRSPQIVRMTP